MLNNVLRTKFLVGISVFFLLYFLIIFHRLFLEYALPGRYDSWFHLALFQEYGNRITSCITGVHSGYSMFPENGLVKYGEPSPLSSIVYLVIKFFVGDPVVSFALFTVFFCSANGLFFYLFATTYSSNATACLAGAVLFSSSNYIFGNIDHQNVYFFGNALLQLFFLRKFLLTSLNKYLLAFVLTGILQIYFSSTVFIYANLAAGALIAGAFFSKTDSGFFLLKIFAAYLFVFVGILPFAFQYVFSEVFSHTFNQASNSSGTYVANIHPIDLIRVMPGNLLYSSLSDIQFPVLNNIRSAFTGVSAALLVLYCVVRRLKISRSVLAIFLIGVVLAAGSGYYYNSNLIPMPMKLFYDIVGGDTILRTPARGYILVVFAISLLSTFALTDISERAKSKLPVLLFISLFVLENVPFTMKFFPAEKFIAETKICQIGKSNQCPEYVVAHLPSKVLNRLPTFSHFPDEVSREFIYTYWAGLEKYNCVNGVNGITPWTRMKNDNLMEYMSEEGNLPRLIQDNHLNYIVWHKDMLLPLEIDQTEFLSSSPLLKLVCRKDQTYLFQIADTTAY